MTSQVGNNQSWRVESLRLTTFLTAPIPAGIGWELIGGAPPEIRSDRPREGVSDQRGPFGDGQLVFLSQPNRVDWQWECGPVELVPADAPQIGIAQGLRRFEQVTDKWLAAARGVHRLALGAVLKLQVADRESGYEMLQRYVPSLTLTPGKKSDLVFQINRPRTSQAVSGLELNRLTKWSVSQFQRLSVQVGAQQGSASVKGGGLGEPSYSCRLELDLSTDAHRTEQISDAALAGLWRELGILAVEIAEKGETA